MLHAKIIGYLFLEKKILKVFTIYGRGGHLGHVTWIIYAIFHSYFPWRLQMKFGIHWQSGFGEKDI